MPNIPEAEARALLGQQLTCEGAIHWLPGTNARTVEIQAGLIDETGTGTNLFVKLSFHRGSRPGNAHYNFSVFQRNLYGLDRIYQLCVNQTSKRGKDAHRQPHEHLGSLRSDGSDAWQDWGYDEVLARFCAQTKIVFIPAPPDPAHTRKRWDCHEQSCQYVWEQLPGV